MTHEVNYRIETSEHGIKVNFSIKPEDRVKEANAITIIRNCIAKLEEL
jgi:hypothetical protein